MFCCQFDPVKNKYTLYAWNIMRLGSLLMLFHIGNNFYPRLGREIFTNVLGHKGSDIHDASSTASHFCHTGLEIAHSADVLVGFLLVASPISCVL